MSKYEPLRHFLERQHLGEVRMSFGDVERVLGFKLPPSQSHRAWWSNNPSNNVMTKEWLAAGYQTEQVDLEGRTLVFKRFRLSPPPSGSNGSGAPRAESPAGANDEERPHPLVGWMKGLTRIAPGVDLTKPSDPEWGETW